MKIEKGKDILVGNQLTNTTYGLKGRIYFLIKKNKIRGRKSIFLKKAKEELADIFLTKTYSSSDVLENSQLIKCKEYLEKKNFNPGDYICIELYLETFFNSSDMSNHINRAVKRVEDLLYLQLIK